jgi:hypothetical protein
MFEDFYMPEFDVDYLSPGISSYGMAAGQPAYNDVTLYGEKVGSPYGMMADQYNAPVGTMGIGGGDFVMAGPSASRIPTSAVTSPYARPSATPSLDFVTDRGGQQGYYFVTNAGRAAKTKANPTGFVSVDPNAEYRLVNERGQNVVVASGTGEQGLRDAYAAAQRLSTEGGKKADWYLERSSPDGKWTRIADDDPKGSDLGVAGKILGAALPIATAFIPGLGVIGTIAMQAASGAAGSALAGGDPLKGAIVGGLTAAGGNVLGPALRGATGIGAKTAGAIGTGLGATAGGLATGQNLQNSLLSGLASGAGSYFIPNIAEELGVTLPGTSGQYDAATNTIINTATPPPSLGISAGNGSNLAGDAGADTLGGDEIVVSGGRAPNISIPAPIFTGQPQAVEPVSANPDEGGLIDVIAARQPSIPIITPSTVPGIGRADLGFTSSDVPLEGVDYEGIDVIADTAPPLSIPVTPPMVTSRTDLGFTGAREGATAPEEDRRSILDTALDAADIATTVLPIIGGVIGGGGGGGGGTLTPDTTRLNFTRSPLRQTLTSGIGGGSGGIGGTGALYPYTPTTYGRAGGDQETEFLFFTRDPVTGAAAAPAIVPASAPGKKEGGEIEDDMVKHLVEYHKNGGHHGPGQVKGIGSGQDDKIPAWLSDGEYVWSAQDVADLGDGSTDEGVRRLDKMRQMVRQQAGRKDVKKIAKPQKGIDKMLKAVGGLA